MDKLIDFVKVYRTIYRCSTWSAVKAYRSLDYDFRKWLMSL